MLHLTVSPVNYHSWRRFWARMFDYFLIGFLFLLLSRNSIFALNNIFLYSALQLIVVISAEAFMLARTRHYRRQKLSGTACSFTVCAAGFQFSLETYLLGLCQRAVAGHPDHDVRPRLVCAAGAA